MQLFLVRHAETEWNELRRYQGHMDIALSPRGLEQVSLLASRLASQDISAIYSSDLSRAYSTAEGIAKDHGLEVEALEALREVNVGAWEGLSIEEIRERHPDIFERWRKDSAHVPFPGGESYLDVKRRVMPVIKDIVRRHSDQRAVIVSHSGPLKVIVCTLLGLDLNERYRFNLSNASLSLVSFSNGVPRIELLNDTCHLLPSVQSPPTDHSPRNTKSPKKEGA